MLWWPQLRSGAEPGKGGRGWNQERRRGGVVRLIHGRSKLVKSTFQTLYWRRPLAKFFNQFQKKRSNCGLALPMWDDVPLSEILDLSLLCITFFRKYTEQLGVTLDMKLANVLPFVGFVFVVSSFESHSKFSAS